MMVRRMEIVEMGLEHIDGVMVVENLSFTIPWSKESFIEEVTNNQFAIYIVAIEQGVVIGYIGMWKIFDEGHITNIAVHPEFRNNGVGSGLLTELLEIAKIQGINALTLEVRKGNTTARSLYERFGFKEAGVRKQYYADNKEDAIIMWTKFNENDI